MFLCSLLGLVRERKYTFEFSFSFLNIVAMLVTGSLNVSSLRRAAFSHECVIPGEVWVVCP